MTMNSTEAQAQPPAWVVNNAHTASVPKVVLRIKKPLAPPGDVGQRAEHRSDQRRQRQGDSPCDGEDAARVRAQVHGDDLVVEDGKHRRNHQRDDCRVCPVVGCPGERSAAVRAFIGSGCGRRQGGHGRSSLGV